MLNLIPGLGHPEPSRTIMWLIIRQWYVWIPLCASISYPWANLTPIDVFWKLLSLPARINFPELSVYNDTAVKKKMIWLTTGRLNLGFWIWVINFESEAWWKYSLNLFLLADWLDFKVSHAVQKQFGWLRHPLKARLRWQDWESPQLLIQWTGL